MSSQITTLFPNIDESYPVAGVDNDTQGFRDNFDVIKTSLGVASVEITELQNITAKVNSTNNFNGNDQINLNIVTATGKTNSLGLVSAAAQIFPILYVNGPYQFATLAGDRTFQINWDISADQLLQTGRLAKLTLQFASDSALETRTVTFAPSSNYLYDESFPAVLTVGVNPVVIELWTFDGGATIYAKYIGEFS